MKVLVLGGAGAMGRHLCRALVDMDCIEQVRVAGIDNEAGQTFCASLDGRATYLSLDVTDDAALVGELEDVDLVANTTGPFFKLAKPILEAAIASGIDYIDICDDVEPTASMLELHAEAEQAGITAIVGMGASPGLTNLLARQAVEALDTVEAIDTSWDLDMTITVDDGFAAAPTGMNTPAAIVHWMHCCSGRAPITKNGRVICVRTLEPVDLDFQHDTTVVGWSVAHPEPVTLALTYPELTDCSNFMTGRKEIFELLRPIRDRIDKGTLTIETAAAMLVTHYNLGAPMSKDAEAARRSGRKTQTPLLAAMAKGKLDGRSATSVAAMRNLPIGGMGASTGIPAAIAIRMIAEGAITEKGVFPPENVVPTAAFFEHFASYVPNTMSSDIVRSQVQYT